MQRVASTAGAGRLLISPSAQLAAEEGRDSVRRWAAPLASGANFRERRTPLESEEIS
jgi:hypothetical protein